MKPRIPLLLLAFAAVLFLGACGADGDDEGSATETIDPSSIATKAGNPGTTTPGTAPVATTTGTASGSPVSADGTGTPAATDATSTLAAEATPVATQDPQRVKAFTNGILGEAQEAYFWMQLITGDIECGPNCPDSLDARWSRTLSACGQGRWEFRKNEDGYSEELHGPLIDALVEGCDMLSAKYSAGGTPDESDEWFDVANTAVRTVGMPYQVLLEFSLTDD